MAEFHGQNNQIKQLVTSGREDSNLRPPAPKAGALPGCATPREHLKYPIFQRKVNFSGTCDPDQAPRSMSLCKRNGNDFNLDF